MRLTLKRLSVLCSASLLLACAGSERSEQIPLPAFGNADEAYVVGRNQHLALRFDEAVLFYRAALRASPTHVNARNGLATLYAERGDYARAIALWQTMTSDGSAASGPDNSFLFSNLGYAQLLAGQFNEALAALEKACLLDPLNHRAWRHLGAVLEKTGQPERAQQMYAQAEALRKHDFKADYAVAERNGVRAIDSAVLASARQEGGWDETEVRLNANGVYELHRIRMVPSLEAAALPPQKASLEIRNGNGVTGMARSLAKKMNDGSLRVVRLSNQKGYGVRQTRVEYHPQFRAAAERVAKRFGTVDVVAVEQVGRADVRLVIGRDMIRSKSGAAVPLATLPKPAPKAG